MARGTLYQIGESRASVGDLRKVARVGRPAGMRFGLVDQNVAEILHLVAQRGDFFVQAGQAHGGGSHIHAAASRTQVHGRADDGDVGLAHGVELRLGAVGWPVA